ncbi:MAG: LacI family DNA-binding transcriptional regulator, partial [Bryocella sp.]
MADAEKRAGKRPISQKALAEYLKLSPSTVSLVMNDAPRARLIPEATRRRILDAAAKFDYRPDFYARYLYSKRSFTAAVVLAAIREPYAAAILAGIDRKLTKEKYLYFTANHYGKAELIREYPRRLLERAVEGFLLINTTLAEDTGRPTIMIGSAPKVDGVPRFALNNVRGGALAFEYLAALGHKHIAVIKGQPFRNAAGQRFAGIMKAARAHGLTLDERLVKELHSGNMPREMTMPEEGYKCGVDLLATGVSFSALIC